MEKTAAFRTRSRRLSIVAFTLVLPVVASGCAFNLACDLFGALLQARLPQVDVCSSFNGACCGDQNGDGLPDECSGFLGTPPCGRFDTAGCVCTVGGADLRGIGQTLVPRAYALPPSATFFVYPESAGQSGVHRAFFETTAQDLQTHHATITYPPAFTFNGFLALGPAETVIGALAVDFNFDFEPDLTLPLRGLTADTAYVDGNASGGYDASDPLVVHSGAHVFTLTLPRGGDGLARTKMGQLALRFFFALYGRVLTNPTTPDTYTVTAAFTSVDPDSGDADDGQGTAPTSFSSPGTDVVIGLPPYGELSPFLCYTTKPTKGTLCGGNAGANEGGACTTDADCGGTAGACVKNPIAKGLIAEVGNINFKIGKASTLCTPAEVDGQGQPADAAAHLRGYQIKPAKGAPAHFPIELQPFTNQLGSVIVTTTKPDRLLMTSAKRLGAPSDALLTTSVENFECEKVKLVKKRCADNPTRKCKKSADCGIEGPCFTGIPKGLTVEIGDQFTTFAAPRTLTVVKPTRYCYAVKVNGEPVSQFGQGLLCYAVKPAPGVAKHAPIVAQIHTANTIAREREDTVKESEICLPSEQTGVQ